MTREPSTTPKTRAAKIAGFAAVAALHAALLAVVGLSQVETETIRPPPLIRLELIPPVRIPPPPPPEIPPEPAPEEAGGSPGASSPVRLPDRPPERPPEIVAPPIPTPAPTPPPVIGVSPVPTPNPNPGSGQGGEGTGSGTGIGSGTGSGRGGSTPPRILRGASQAELRSVHPAAALRAGRSGEAVVSCYISGDQRVDRCRVLSARPSGEGFDEAGLAAAMRFWRFQPPTRDGVVRNDQPVTITIQFGRALAPQG